MCNLFHKHTMDLLSTANFPYSWPRTPSDMGAWYEKIQSDVLHTVSLESSSRNYHELVFSLFPSVFTALFILRSISTRNLTGSSEICALRAHLSLSSALAVHFGHPFFPFGSSSFRSIYISREPYSLGALGCVLGKREERKKDGHETSSLGVEGENLGLILTLHILPLHCVRGSAI